MVGLVAVIVDLTDEVGWERLELIHDLRDAILAGYVRCRDGQVQTRTTMVGDLLAAMARHPDVVDYVLADSAPTVTPPAQDEGTAPQ